MLPRLRGKMGCVYALELEKIVKFKKNRLLALTLIDRKRGAICFEISKICLYALKSKKGGYYRHQPLYSLDRL